MDDQQKARIRGFARSMPKEECLKPGASYDLAKTAPAMPKLMPMLHKQILSEPFPPRLCYGYILDDDKFIRVAWELGATITDCSGIATHDAVEYFEEQIGHELDFAQVWLEGKDTIIISLCSNWDDDDDLKKAARAARKLKAILGETEKPKWFLDVLHPQWTVKPELW
ncbi:hypothetical protein CERSUDRAFT_99011 [Gelatoporia subvermispora B]|uniref:Uncharacterized protein n=1 Tax=Ceriporiopsis subvermispora (strain B) TaxID=914234 RepID=M2R482_CERS8|nr:hypothetical protein CERSUDRAFT_99011 [Gelatoporia subvermispora B]